MQILYPFWYLCPENRGLHNIRALSLRLLLVLHATVVTQTNSKLFLYLHRCGGCSYGTGFSSIQNILGLSRIPPQGLPPPKLILLPVYVLNSQHTPVSVEVQQVLDASAICKPEQGLHALSQWMF